MRVSRIFSYGRFIGAGLFVALLIHFLLQPQPLTQLRRRPPYYIIDNTQDGFGLQQRHWLPDIFHLLRLETTPLSLTEIVQLRSIYINHGPDKIIVHASNATALFESPLWPLVSDIPGLGIALTQPLNQTRWGEKFKTPKDALDAKKLDILDNHGGVYLQPDVLVGKSYRQFFKFEFAAEYTSMINLDTLWFASQKRSRFISLHMNTYHTFEALNKTDNQTAKKTEKKNIVVAHPHLLHKLSQGKDEDVLILEPSKCLIYQTDQTLENTYFAVPLHLKSRKQCLEAKKRSKDPEIYTLENIRRYNATLGRFFRKLLFGTEHFVEKKRDILSVRQLVKLLGYPLGARKPFPGDDNLVPLLPIDSVVFQ